MDLKTKIASLSATQEKTLREAILVPLLSRIGFKAVTLYHGPRERGKDIICFDYDRLGGREYLAIVAKAADLDGTVSSSASLREIVYQIEQCFDVPYEDLFGMTQITMDRVWVVTSRRIVPGAADSVYSYLAKRNLSKLVRFISGENLVQLIDEHYMAYWDESLEPVDILKEQKSRLTNFSRDLLLSMGARPSDVESTLTQVIQSSFPPVVSPSSDRTLSRVSPYRVEFDSIDSLYSHDFHSHTCGVIRDMFFKTKKNLYFAMFDVDEIVDHYEEAIKKTDPRELVKSFWDHLSKEYPFWHGSGRASDAIRDIEYLEDGLKDIDRLREKLAKIGRLDWATSLVDSVKEQEAAIKKFQGGAGRVKSLLLLSSGTRFASRITSVDTTIPVVNLDI